MRLIAKLCVRSDGLVAVFRSVFVHQFFLKEQECNDANGDRSISDIEDGREKFKLLSSYQRHPGRKMRMYHGKIQHVYYASVKKALVAVMERKMGNTHIALVNILRAIK